MSKSKLHLLKELPKEKRDKFIKSLTETEAKALIESGEFLLRPEQKVPKELLEGKKRNWLIVSGRGWGKNFSATFNLFNLISNYGYQNIIYVGRTKEDVRDIIIDGPSGIKKNCPSNLRMEYEGHKNRIIFPDYDAVVRLRSGETPDSLRGPNTDLVIFDELAAYQYAQETWDNGQFGLRLNSRKGYPPVCIVTTTPRPIDLIKALIKDDNTIITTGSTYDNPDLSETFISYLKDKYEHTTLGRQELYGHILDNIEGALWNMDTIKRVDDKDRAKQLLDPSIYERIVISIDPAVTSHDDSDLTGIVTVGKLKDKYIVLDDSSGRYTAYEWAKKVKYLYDYYEADRVIGEVNQGGDLIESNLRSIDKNISYKSVRAYKGKYLRAEPIASLYEQGKVQHIKVFKELEDEMTTYVPGLSKKSPDRLDALVYAITELSQAKQINIPAGMGIPTRI